MTTESRPSGQGIGVGVAAVITNKQGQILVSKRKGSLGSGSWQFPGGHLEFHEEILACAERETEEETGLKVKGLKIATVTNDIFTNDKKHYITLFVHCEMLDQNAEPKLMEPEKCDGWHWWTWEDLLEVKTHGESSGAKLFLPMTNLLDKFATLDELKQQFR